MESNTWKLTLAGWLKENDPDSYSSPEKLQMFLLLYELFSKAAGEEADLGDLVVNPGV